MQVHHPAVPKRVDPRGEQTAVKTLEISSKLLDICIHFGDMRAVN
jgi:hypothetical protein